MLMAVSGILFVFTDGSTTDSWSVVGRHYEELP